MPEWIAENYSLAIFLVLATGKGLVEFYGYRHQNRTGGAQSGERFSAYIIGLGLLMPRMILAEVVVLHHTIPLPLSLTFAVVYAVLLVIRVLAIRALGPYYSVNIRIVEDHRLVTEGVYRYVRHPIYLVGLLENALYPLACGAYLTAAVLVVLGTPALLMRRAQEEGALTRRFGAEYDAYKERTAF